MASGWPALRACALLLCGALATHELRYLIAFGGDAPAGLGHGYLAPARPSSRAVRARVLWPVASAALLGTYVGQELAEGLLAHGHPGGLDGVFGAGGWVAVPLAAGFGGAIALALRVAELVDRSPHRPPFAAARLTAPPLIGIARAAAAAFGGGRRLADHLAGRGPPPARA